MAANLLQIQLLGDFRLVNGDELVTAVNSPRMQSLLAYLLLHLGAPQPRYHVAFLLWPDSPEGQARSNLRNLLHRLRHAFPEIEDFVQEDNRDLYWKAGTAFTCDVANFEHALAQAQQAEAAGDQDMLQAALEQAVEIYTGDLLPSCYDEWILQHREGLHQAFLSALENLSVLEENGLHYRQAISIAQRLLRCDPLREEIYRRLMQLYAATGDRTGAMRVYQTCTTVLKRELDVDPDDKTRAVYESLLVSEGLAEAGFGSPRLNGAAAVQQMPTGGAGSRKPHHLPEPLTSFVGREHDIARVKAQLSTTRLLTLTGPLGAGKTRLALEVAARLAAGDGQFPDGVWWVELAPITNPALVPQAVATVLGIREKPGEPLTKSLIEALHDRSLLLLLDNCEHLIAACGEFAAGLLRFCPRLCILATSREALGIMGETAWQVLPLAYPLAAAEKAKQEAISSLTSTGAEQEIGPEEAGGVTRYEAVTLFVERAAAVLPTFHLTARNAAAVAQICRRLEGIPLAIELAAARVKMMAVEQIAARLDDALHLLKANWGGELPHHQTLKAAIDWSYDLLTEKEQVLLRRFSVFAGGFTLGAAEQIAGFQVGTNTMDPTASLSPADVLDLLSRLIDKSLVVVEEREQPGEVRYRLLEVVRQYARERLVEAAELEMALRWHANFYLALVEEAFPKLRSVEQETWLNRLDRENDNLRAALAWAAGRSDGAEIGLRLAAGLWQFWDVRGYFNEGRQWLAVVLTKASDEAEDETTAQAAETAPGGMLARSKALNAAGGLAWSQGDYSSARTFLSESLTLKKALGNQRDIAAGLLNLGILNISLCDYASALLLLEESLSIFRALGYRQGIANVLNTLGTWASDQGDYASARSSLEESLALLRELGDKRGIAVVLGNLGVAAWRQGDCQAARSLLTESLERYQNLGDKRGAATALNELSRVNLQLREYSLASQLLKQSLAIWQELGNKEGIAVFLEGSAELASRWCDDWLAARLLGAAEILRERIGSPIAPADRLDYARIQGCVRSALSADRLEAAWREGRMLSLETAVELAIHTCRKPD